MRKMLLLIGCVLSSAMLFAQQINGVVKDAQGKPLNGSTVSLMQVKDSSVVKLAVTKEDGRFSIANAGAGSYLLNVSYVGFSPVYSAPFEFNGTTNLELPAIELTKLTGDMKAVTVTSRKPMVEVKADKTILNVENSVNAVGNTALELLRKAPGVMVDRDDNLSLSGKNGVQVYIDGKPSPLRGADLASYLKSLQSAQIESIEIITNPSAKYDAAGNAGIINIRLKKNKAYGANGSVNAGWNIGVFAKYNSGISLNYRNKKVNLFGNYNYNRARNENFMTLYREASDSSFQQRATMTNRDNSNGFKVGMDFYASNRSILGVMVNGNLSDNGFGNNSRTHIGYVPSKTPDRLLLANNSNDNQNDNLNFNLNYRFADTSGRELNVDADYGYYNMKGVQLQPNQFYTADGNTLINSRIYRMLTPSEIDIYSSKIDYEQNFLKGRLGLGGKFSYVETENSFDKFVRGSSTDFLDRANNFRYTENINAVYANFNRQFKGFMIQAGLRVENTKSDGISKGRVWDNAVGQYTPIDSLTKRNYTNAFPSASVTFNKNPMNQWSFSYSRRIDRPSYQDLNPFEFNLDEYTFQRGNTVLRPQYTNSVAVTNIFKQWITTTLNYSHVSDVFAQIVDTTNSTRSFITKKNLATQDIVSLNLSIPFQYKWYSVFANINSYYSQYNADLGAGRKVDLNVLSYNVYMQHSFKLAKSTSAEISGFYAAPSVWEGTFKTREMWGVDAGLQHSILKGKGSLKATVTDVFQTMRWRINSNFANQQISGNGGWESRQFRLNFTYRFGNNQVKAARQRKTAAEDESNRVKTGGGGLGQ